MEYVMGHAQSLVDNVVPMIVLLGLLIFVHELGHFLVAKYFKVRVEVFSLGFGPKIFKFKRGETVYAISAIPLGGYVKMFGDDPTATIDEELKKHSFLHKPVSQRIAVVLAGPIMNFLFAILVFTIVAAYGEQTFAPHIGDVTGDSAAAAAGFKSGDQIKSIAGKSVQSWDQLQKAIEKNADRSVEVQVARENGATETLQVTPKLVPNKNVLSWDRMVGDIDGLSLSSKASFIGVKESSPAAAAGLKTGDYVKTINGKSVERWRSFESAFAEAASSNQPLNIELERGRLTATEADAEPAVVKVTLPATTLAASGIEYPELYLANIEKDSPADKAGLKIGDRLLSINDTKVESFDQVAGLIRSHGDKTDKEALNILVSRSGTEMTITVAPNLKERMNNQGKEERRFEIGIRPMIVDAQPETVVLQTSNPVEALQKGFSQTLHWTNLTVLSFVRLAQAQVSPKNIGGFFSIGAMAKRSWQIGLAQFLNVMALISINLFILNLLPIPVLDGGHLVFYSIEAIKGAPLSLRKMEIAQQVGLVLLLCLMVFALYNDVTRLFN